MSISVIIPVYNGERYISTCINSLLEQTYTDWNAILVNDGSTDNSISVMQSWAERDSRIVVVSQHNHGVAAARDKGIREAKGEYILFLDVDDTLESDCLEKLVCGFDSSIDMVASAFTIVQKSKRVKKKVRNATLAKVDYLRKVLSGHYGWELCAKMYRKELFDEPLSVPCQIRIGEDAAVFVQLATRSRNVRIINDALYNYIQYPSSASHQKAVDLAEETLQAAYYIDELLKKETFYPEIKNEIDTMYLLFYSNSTRKAYLGLKHPLISQIYDEHFSLKAIRRLPMLKRLYIPLSLWIRKVLA